MSTIWPSYGPGVARATGWASPFSFALFGIQAACWTRWRRRPCRCSSLSAKQIGVDPALFGEYARRAETRREHVLELQRLLRLRSFGLD